MDIIRLFTLACILSVIAISPVSIAATKKSNWGYEGDTGPEHWGKIRTRFKTCEEGQMQSPINIKETNFDKKAAALVFGYAPTAVNIVETEHHMEVRYRYGSTFKLNNKTYELSQFHFHHPSEHTIKGKSFPMEIHFVHHHSSSRLAVIAVGITVGKENPVFGAILAGLEAVKNGKEHNTIIDATKLLPTKKRYFSYAGSLTTPPCTEDVHWLVFKKPIQASAEQIAAFQKLYPANSRPAQPTGNRKVTERRM